MKRAIVALLVVAALAFLVAQIAARNVDASESAPARDPEPELERKPALEPVPAPRGPGARAASPAPPGPGGGTPAPPGDAPATPPTAAEIADALKKLAAAYEAAKARRPTDRPKTYPATRDGILDAMKSVKPAIRECYEPWVALNPALEGRITTRFAIPAEGGAPAGASVAEDGLGHDLLNGCVLSVLETDLDFEAPAEGAINISFPIVFAANDTAAPED